MRLMALTLILSYWLGRESQYHGLDQGLNWILEAYASGKLAYDEYQKAKEDKEKAEAAKKTEEEAVEKEASTDANAKTASTMYDSTVYVLCNRMPIDLSFVVSLLESLRYHVLTLQ